MKRCVRTGGGLAQGDCRRSRQTHTNESSDRQQKKGAVSQTRRVLSTKWQFLPSTRLRTRTNANRARAAAFRGDVKSEIYLDNRCLTLCLPLPATPQHSKSIRWMESVWFFFFCQWKSLHVTQPPIYFFSYITLQFLRGRLARCTVLSCSRPSPPAGIMRALLQADYPKTKAKLLSEGGCRDILWGSIRLSCRCWWDSSKIDCPIFGCSCNLHVQFNAQHVQGKVENIKKQVVWLYEIWSCPYNTSHACIRMRIDCFYVGHPVKMYLSVMSLFTLLHWLTHKLINSAARHPYAGMSS